MSMNQNLTKAVSRKLKYYMEVKRLEDGFDVRSSVPGSGGAFVSTGSGRLRRRGVDDRWAASTVHGTTTSVEREEEVRRVLVEQIRNIHFFSPEELPNEERIRILKRNRVPDENIRLALRPRSAPSRPTSTRSLTSSASAPFSNVTRGEAERLISMATRLLVATENVVGGGEGYARTGDRRSQGRVNRVSSARSAGRSDSVSVYRQDGEEMDAPPILQQEEEARYPPPPRPSPLRRKKRIWDLNGHRVYSGGGGSGGGSGGVRNQKSVWRRIGGGGSGRQESVYPRRKNVPEYIIVPNSRKPTLASEGVAIRKEIPSWIQREMENLTARDSVDTQAKWVRPVDERAPDREIDKQMQKKKRDRPKSAKNRPRPENFIDPNRLMEEWLQETERIKALAGEDRRDSQVQTSEEIGIQTEQEYVAPNSVDRVPSPPTVASGQRIVYKVSVFTARDRNGASTKAEVRLTMFGERGKSERVALRRSLTHKVPFQKGQEDVFRVEAFDLGPLTKILIGHERREIEFSWYLEKVGIQDPETQIEYVFDCGAWLSGRDGSGNNLRTLKLTKTLVVPEIIDEGSASNSSFTKGRETESETSSLTSLATETRSFERAPHVGARDDDDDEDSSSSSSSNSSKRKDRSRGAGIDDDDETSLSTSVQGQLSQRSGASGKKTKKPAKSERVVAADEESAATYRSSSGAEVLDARDVDEAVGGGAENRKRVTFEGRRDSSSSDARRRHLQKEREKRRAEERREERRKRERMEERRSKGRGGDSTTSPGSESAATDESTRLSTASPPRRSSPSRRASPPHRRRTGSPRPSSPFARPSSSLARASPSPPPSRPLPRPPPSPDDNFFDSRVGGEIPQFTADSLSRGSSAKSRLSAEEEEERGERGRTMEENEESKGRADATDAVVDKIDAGFRSLHDAAKTGISNLVRHAVMAGGRVNATDDAGWTPFHVAASLGHEAALKTLTALGADAFAKTNEQQTALHLAAAEGKMEVCWWLVARCHIPVESVDLSDRTAADLAADSGFDDVARFLRAGAENRDFLAAVAAARSDASATSGSGFLDDFETTSDASGLTMAKTSPRSPE